MKPIIILMCGFLTSFTALSQQTIWDQASKTSPQQTNSCIGLGDQSTEKLARDNVYRNWTSIQQSSTCSPSQGTACVGAFSYSSQTTYNGDRCLTTGVGEYDRWLVNTNGDKINQSKEYISTNEGGSVGTATSCPPDSPQGSMNYLYTAPYKADGSTQPTACYNPQELSDIDSCPDSYSDQSSIIPTNGHTKSNICVSKPDGSKCAYSLSDTGDHYQSTFENENCYNNLESEEIEVPPPSDDGCIGQFCPADPTLHCDSTGKCEESCGYINDAFYCSKDKIKGGDPWQPPPPPPCEVDCEEPIDEPIEEPPGGEEECDPETQECPPTGTGGGGTQNIDLTPIVELLEFNPTRDKLTGNEQLNNQAQSTLDSVQESLTSEFTKTAEQAGLQLIDGSDVQYIETLFGTFPQSSCKNPVFLKATLDWCSRAPTINEWLYWIFAVMTVIACVHQLLDIVRR